jgi:hypothetical protein
MGPKNSIWRAGFSILICEANCAFDRIYGEGELMNRFLVALASVSLAALPLVAGPVTYTFNDLMYPGSVTSAAYGVNDSGTVTGYYIGEAGGAKTVFYGTPSSLNSVTISGCTAGAGAGVNDSGTIVGLTTCSSKSQGFLTTTSNTGTVTKFAPPVGTAGTTSILTSQATGVNSSGTVAGYFSGKNASGATIVDGYTTTNQTTFTSFSDPSETVGTFAAGIDNSGDVVGFYIGSGNITSAYLYEGGLFYNFNDPSAVGLTAAEGIDSNGDIFGFYHDASGESHGFLYTGYSLSGGVISGGTWYSFDDPNADGTSYTPPGTSTAISGTQILGVDSNGNEIVGQYVVNGGLVGFYATTGGSTTPEPGTVITLLSGFGLMAGWAWRRKRKANS